MKGPPLSELEGEFRRYLLEVRSLRQSSLDTYAWTFRRFTRFLAARRVRSARRISLDLAYKFLESYARGKSCSHVRALQGAVKNTLQFLYYVGMLRTDISELLIAPRIWRLADVPKGFTDEELARMFANLRTETPYDHRERLVMLLFICYGLRLGEVTRISLDDINWRSKTIAIRERKNRVPLVLPLIPPVEEALHGYLEHFRPGGLRTRRLFVTIKRRSRAPLKEPAVYEIVRRSLRGCGIAGSPTMFRHTLATHLINSGVSLHVIQAVLGHRRSQSTRIYAKVHWKALKEVADNYSLLL